MATNNRTYIDAMLSWAGCSNDTVAQCHLGPRGVLRRTTFEASSEYATKTFSAGAIAALIDAIDERQANAVLGRGSILLDAYGGAINRVPAAATAFVHRNELFSLQQIAEWKPDAPASTVTANRKWLSDLRLAIRPAVSGRAYQNYIDPDLTGWAAAYYGASYHRLRTIKRKYDPTNFFRFAQSIRP